MRPAMPGLTYANCPETAPPFDSLQSPYGIYRPWRPTQGAAEQQNSDPELNKDNKFRVTLDIRRYSPIEITVKATDRFITIEGEHEEMEDEYGCITNKFVRRYGLPDNCDPATVNSSLSDDGVLTVTASLLVPETSAARNVPTVQPGAEAHNEEPEADSD